MDDGIRTGFTGVIWLRIKPVTKPGTGIIPVSKSGTGIIPGSWIRQGTEQ